MKSALSLVNPQGSLAEGRDASRRAGTRAASPRHRAGFSLVEVLLAMFILAIGMMMVMAVFPVGANWTRQTAEDSTAQTVVQNAMSVIKTHYGANGNLRNYLNADYLTYNGGLVRNIPANAPAPNNYNSILQAPFTVDYPYDGGTVRVPGPFVLQELPEFLRIPFNERAYQYGAGAPFPARDWTKCTYFWTALVRLNPVHRNVGWVIGSDVTNGIIPSSSYNYDIYILVFRKGSVEQRFSNSGPTKLGTEIPGTRNSTGNVPYANDEALIPSVVAGNYGMGVLENGTWTTPAVPAIGQNGIGLISGTVFKQVMSGTYGSAQPRPDLIRDPKSANAIVEPIIFSPAADNTALSASPLIYIYQTTLTF